MYNELTSKRGYDCDEYFSIMCHKHESFVNGYHYHCDYIANADFSSIFS
jgi:hypothetical protein